MTDDTGWQSFLHSDTASLATPRYNSKRYHNLRLNKIKFSSSLGVLGLSSSGLARQDHDHSFFCSLPLILIRQPRRNDSPPQRRSTGQTAPARLPPPADPYGGR